MLHYIMGRMVMFGLRFALDEEINNRIKNDPVKMKEWKK